jgi:cell division protein ZapA (FtsZ GTPase activity inhibitor)
VGPGAAAHPWRARGFRVLAGSRAASGLPGGYRDERRRERSARAGHDHPDLRAARRRGLRVRARRRRRPAASRRAESIKIGGFEFDRLSSKLDQQTQEISQLRQTISTTINIGSDLINQARNGFSETKDVLDRVRAFLPDTPEVRRQLAIIDDLARRIDSESWPDLFVGIITMHDLIEEAGRVTASAVVPTTEAADTAEEEAQAEEADTVLSDYLGDTGTASEGRS